MQNPIFTVTLILFTLSGCIGKQTKVTGEGEEIISSPSLPYKINLEESVSGKETSIHLTASANEIQYIPLETTSDCLLKRVHSYVYYDNSLLISDFSYLYQFDKQGRFISRIGNKGSGPKDYVYVTAIVKNNTSDRLYLFASAGKLNIYDKDINYLQSVTLKGSYTSMYGGVITPSDELVMYLGSTFKMPTDTTTVYSLAKLNASGQIIHQFPHNAPLEYTNPGMIVGDVPLYRYNESIRFMDFGCDTLFTVLPDNKMTPYAICPLGAKKREISVEGFGSDQQEKQKSKYMINTINEDGRFLYIYVDGVDDGSSRCILFDKKTGETTNIGEGGLVNDIDGGLPFFPWRIEADGTMVMWMHAETFIEKVLALDYQKQKERYGDKFEKLWKLASEMKPDDNPILITVK